MNYPECNHRQDENLCKNSDCQFFGRRVSDLTCRKCVCEKMNNSISIAVYCPKCGSRAEIQSRPSRGLGYCTEHFVECDNCHLGNSKPWNPQEETAAVHYRRLILDFMFHCIRYIDFTDEKDGKECQQESSKAKQ